MSCVAAARNSHYDEYAQKDRNGNVVDMWARMARGQLAKCAEALALRKAFPQDLSGIYTDAEMHQSSTDEQQIDYSYTPPETPAIDTGTGEVLDAAEADGSQPTLEAEAAS